MIDRALVIADPWIDLILSGQKTWEMRSRRTNIRGKIGLIRKGSGLIVGECEIVDCLTDLSFKNLIENYEKHRIIDTDLLDLWPIAWVVKNAIKWSHPKPYKHPPGAVSWVKIGDGI